MVSGTGGAIGVSVLWRNFRLEEGNVKQSLVSGKGCKKKNANRRYLRTAKVCFVVHRFVFSLFQALGQKARRWATSGVWEKRKERAPVRWPRVWNRLFVIILNDTQLKSDIRVGRGQEMVREKKILFKGQGILFWVPENWYFEEKSGKIELI